jgi:NAD(P)-dependent dehydrogenase (short-subunit alcohol dehydrogenase family)
MDLGLTGKSVIVTGGNSGIGLGVTQAFLAEGARVTVGDLAVEAAEALDGDVLGHTCDLSTADGCSDLIERVITDRGAIDVVVNNVGVAPWRDGFLTVKDDEWDRLLEINFKSMIRVCRGSIPHMQRQGGGAIVSIASDVGRQPDPFFVDYAVSKASVLMLSKAIAVEFGPDGIRSNVVSPGPTRTPLWDRPGGFAESIATSLGMDDVEEAIRHFVTEIRKLPTRRMGRPEDVAAAVLFLASEQASQVTGADYRVDGGVQLAV